MRSTRLFQGDSSSLHSYDPRLVSGYLSLRLQVSGYLLRAQRASRLWLVSACQVGLSGVFTCACQVGLETLCSGALLVPVDWDDDVSGLHAVELHL